MNRPDDDFPPRLNSEQIREALAAADALDRVLRHCALVAAAEFEDSAFDVVKALRTWAVQRPPERKR